MESGIRIGISQLLFYVQRWCVVVRLHRQRCLLCERFAKVGGGELSSLAFYARKLLNRLEEVSRPLRHFELPAIFRRFWDTSLHIFNLLLIPLYVKCTGVRRLSEGVKVHFSLHAGAKHILLLQRSLLSSKVALQDVYLTRIEQEAQPLAKHWR